MSANEFEKQVQQQLDHFQLNPSASVWQKVEEEIREKKRKRIVFFILLPVALALLGFSIYQFWYPGKKTENNQSSLTVTEKNVPATAKVEAPGKPGDATTSSAEQTSADQLPANTNKKDEGIEKTPTAGKNETVVTRTATGFSTTNSSIGKTNEEKKVKPAKTPVNIQKNNDNTLVITSDIPSTQNNAVAGNITVPGTKDIAVQPDHVNTKTELPAGIDNDMGSTKKDSIKADDVTTPDSKKEEIAKKKKGLSKIKWGVDFSTGLAFNNSGTLTFARAEAFDMMYYNPGNITGVGSSNPSNPPAVIIPPSTIKPGLSFKLGLVAEIKISRRSSFSAGLQYVYSSNRMKVGAVTDTAVVLQSNFNSQSQTRVNVDKLYTGTPKNNYTNSYHFIQLPVSYYWQVNKSKKLPVRLNATAAVGYLLSTNALLYDGALGGIYYKDKNAYNKMHFNLGTGLSFGWHAKNGSEWVIGPDLSFDMSRLVKGDEQYLMFGGISTKWFFPKKKNK